MSGGPLRRSSRIAATRKPSRSAVIKKPKSKSESKSKPAKLVRKFVDKAVKVKKLLKPAHRQSPIDIIANEVCCDADTCKVDTINICYKQGDCCDVIVNEGGFKVNVKKNCESTLCANHLPGKYQLAQFHAHWGCDGSEGSEHFLNGKKLSGEVHFVFWNTKYESINVALEKDDGLAVLGVFLKEGKESSGYGSLLETIKKATGSSTPVEMPKDFNIDVLLPSADKREFVTYLGSLTTPPYNECVVWTLFTEPVEVSAAQLNILRNITKANHRPCQELCGRKIKSSQNVSL